MECVDPYFGLSMIWAAIFISLIAKLRSDNYMRPFLMELASPPILMAAVLAIAFTYFFYEPLPAPERQAISTFLNKPAHMLQSLICNFQVTFNILGVVLPIITIYTFLDKNHPEVVQGLKEKINELFR